MTNHPVLVKSAIAWVLGLSIDGALIVGLHLHDRVVILCIAAAVGILSGLAVNLGMPDVR